MARRAPPSSTTGQDPGRRRHRDLWSCPEAAGSPGSPWTSPRSLQAWSPCWSPGSLQAWRSPGSHQAWSPMRRPPDATWRRSSISSSRCRKDRRVSESRCRRLLPKLRCLCLPMPPLEVSRPSQPSPRALRSRPTLRSSLRLVRGRRRSPPRSRRSVRRWRKRTASALGSCCQARPGSMASTRAQQVLPSWCAPQARRSSATRVRRRSRCGRRACEWRRTSGSSWLCLGRCDCEVAPPACPGSRSYSASERADRGDAIRHTFAGGLGSTHMMNGAWRGLS
mmetsp:Transcript_185/g.511  ORF Transcript_185/g.511 Transcript_185/m.511 type:complete len:280 (+) Transcript_185:474-1313(+)